MQGDKERCNMGSFGFAEDHTKMSLRSVQLPLDHLFEMRDRAVCHQHSNGMRNHVLV